MRKKIDEILLDREIIPLDVAESLGETFLQWEIKGVIWSDMVEDLLENGYMIMFDTDDNKAIVSKSFGEQSPEQISKRKDFFRRLFSEIDNKST